MTYLFFKPRSLRHVFATSLFTRFLVSKIVPISHAASVFERFTSLCFSIEIKPIKSSPASSNGFFTKAGIKFLIPGFQMNLRDTDCVIFIIITADLLRPDNLQTLGVVFLLAGPVSVHVDTGAGSPCPLRAI